MHRSLVYIYILQKFVFRINHSSYAYKTLNYFLLKLSNNIPYSLKVLKIKIFVIFESPQKLYTQKFHYKNKSMHFILYVYIM